MKTVLSCLSCHSMKTNPNQTMSAFSLSMHEFNKCPICGEGWWGGRVEKGVGWGRCGEVVGVVVGGVEENNQTNLNMRCPTVVCRQPHGVPCCREEEATW